MHDMNSSLGSKFSKPKDNSVFLRFLIFPTLQSVAQVQHVTVGRRGAKKNPNRQICLNSSIGSNASSSGNEILSEQQISSQKKLSGLLEQNNLFAQPLEVEISNDSFWELYAGDAVELHSKALSSGSSIAKLSKTKFLVGNRKVGDFPRRQEIFANPPPCGQNPYEIFKKRDSEFLLASSVFSTIPKENFDRSENKMQNGSTQTNGLFSTSDRPLKGSTQSQYSAAVFEPSLKYKSKNLLTFLFSIFLSDSQFVSLTTVEKAISSSSFQKDSVVKKSFLQKPIGIQAFLSSLKPRSIPAVGGVLSGTGFIHKTKGKNQIFPFFIFFYLICLGFKGSQDKCILHEQRISSCKVSTSISTGMANAKADQTLVSSQNLQTNLRFSEYSPIKTNIRIETAQASKISYIYQKVFVNLRLEKILRYTVHISTQFFVFFLIQNLISENNFGRHNPLRQKDSKTNQARILWPKKAYWFQFKPKSVSRTKLPGIQDISTLLEVLIQNLKKGGVNSDKVSFVAPPKGYLFVGPPGTGKTLLAQEIAQLAEVPFICVSASEIQKQIEIGTRIGALRLRKLFQQAQTLTPCILFFDEIDAIAQRQSQHDSKLFTEFLIQMDSWGKKPSEISTLKQKFSARSHSVILGTTNYLDRLDSAFVRSGRFDRILALNYPSKKIRFDILTFYLKKHNPITELNTPTLKKKDLGLTNNFSGLSSLNASSKVFLGTNLGLNYFSFVTDGFSQAHLAKLVNESLLFTISQNESINQKRFLKIFSKNTGLTEHSFRSLLHGLKQMLIHRKNLPSQNIEVLN